MRSTFIEDEILRENYEVIKNCSGKMTKFDQFISLNNLKETSPRNGAFLNDLFYFQERDFSTEQVLLRASKIVHIYVSVSPHCANVR